MPDPTDERLAAILASIAGHLVVPDDTPADTPADAPTGVPVPDPGANGSHPALPDGGARHDDVGPASGDGSTHADDQPRADDRAVGGGTAAEGAARPGDAPIAAGTQARSGRDADSGTSAEAAPQAGDGTRVHDGNRAIAGSAARGGDPAGDGEPAGGGGAIGGGGGRPRPSEPSPRRRLAARARRPAERDGRQRRKQDDRDRWRRGLVAAAVVIVVATVVGVVAPVREAVASWFGIGSTGVERVDEGDGRGDPADLPFLSTYLAPVDRATAEQELGAGLPVPERLGPPPVLGTPPEGGVVMAWADGATTLWVQRNRQRPAEMVSKLLTVDDRFERIHDLGEDAAVVEGAHVLETPLRRLAAGTVLIWLDDGFEYRLESDLGVDEMTAIAHEISPG